jgi:uncharacterized protein YcbK (DUF882 family)
VALFVPALLHSPARANTETPLHRLRMFHTHTGERIDVAFRDEAGYIPEGLAKLDHFLRDHRTGDVHHYDPRLFDLLNDLLASAGNPEAELQIICGYRSPWSNEYLRTHTAGVAKRSLHMEAEAIDIRLPGVPTAKVRDLALSLGKGGVGFYPTSNFVHVDVGRVRRW